MKLFKNKKEEEWWKGGKGTSVEGEGGGNDPVAFHA